MTPPPNTSERKRRRADPTLSSLGRAPARTSIPPPTRDPAPDHPDRGALRRWIHGALLDNLGLKFLSIVLAITVFLLVNTDRDREITARIGVSYALPDDMALVTDRVDEVRVIVKGPWRRLRQFDETRVDRINLDLRHAPSGEIVITPDMIHLPHGLTVESITPGSVRVAFDRIVEKTVEVTPQISGRPQHGYVVAGLKPVPATVKVRGAERTLAALPSVRTREVSVEGRTEGFVAETDAEPPSGVALVGTSQVLVHVAVDEELVSRKLPGQPVVARGDNVDPAKWTLTPSQVDVTLTGSVLAVDKAKAQLGAIVRLAPNDKAKDVDVVVEGVPAGVGVKLSPERVHVAPVR